MEDDVDAGERVADGIGVTDVAFEQLNIIGQVIGPETILAVHLRIEAVEDAHAMAAPQQSIGQMRTDEPSPASDQNRLAHFTLFLIFNTGRRRRFRALKATRSFALSDFTFSKPCAISKPSRRRFLRRFLHRAQSWRTPANDASSSSA